MNELVERLQENQPVVVGGSQPTLEDLRYRIEELEYVFVKFTETKGGTDLGLSLDRAACDVSKADFDKGSGTVHVEGTVVLNGDPVRCVADIDVGTLKGTGRLVVVDESELVHNARVTG
jgi:Core binding factor beta subunit